MNRIFLIIKFIIIGTLSYCQDTSKEIQDSKKIMAKLDECNFVYLESVHFFRYFPYTLKLEIQDTSNILIEGRDIIIFKHSNNVFTMFIGDSIYNTYDLIFYSLKDGVKTEICRKNIWVNDLPISVGIMFDRNKLKSKYLGLGSGTKITYEELKYGSLKGFINQDLGYDLEFPVKSFTIGLVVNDSLIEIKEDGNKLNREQLSYISKLKKGCPIIFKDIRIQKLSGGLMTLQPIVFFLD